MFDSESISASEISDSESISASEISDSGSISETSEYDRELIVQRIFGIQTDTIISKKNKDTFVQTPESVTKSVTNWGSSIAYIYDDYITCDLYKLAIENDTHSIIFVKSHLITKEEYSELCLLAVTRNGSTMKYISQKMQTQELVDAAIKESCWAIQYCIDEFKTYENCLSAISRNGRTIQHVPKEFIDRKLCLAAARARYCCLHLIPAEFIDKELCHIAVGANGRNVKNVPDSFMSSELGWLAITSPDPHDSTTDIAGSNIQYVSAKHITKEIIIESARRWYPTYSKIPKECITEEIEDAVLEVAPYCIKDMKQTPKRWIRVLKICPYLIENQLEEEGISKEVAEYIFSLEDEIKNRISSKVLDYLKTFTQVL